MYKSFIKKVLASICVIGLALSSNTFSSVVGDYDGQAFVTKDKFEELKNELNLRITSYENSIDNKIDGMIADYINAIRTEKKNVPSTLNTFTESRRTFYNVINNPTASGQDDLYISTAGMWVWSQPTPYSKQTSWDFIDGYSFAGLNNHNPPAPYYGGHNKTLVTLDNSKNGKYMFIDKKKLEKKDGSETDILYIYDEYRKNLKYKIVSVGCQVSDAGSDLDQGRSLVIGPGKTSNDLPQYGGPTSISWNNTYNWSGKRNRSAGAGKEVEANEALILVIENDDYDTGDSVALTKVNWVSGLSGSTIFTDEVGCLSKTNQYKWTKKISNFSLGHTGQQAIFYRMYKTVTLTDGTIEYSRSRNSANGANNVIPLEFYVPEITELKGNNIAVLDVSNKIASPAYYYSGIPVLEVPRSAMTLTIKLKAKINKLVTTAGNSGVSFALKADQFENKAIGSETASDLLYSGSYTASNLPDEIEIFLDEDKIVGIREKTIWLKGLASNTNCSVTFETSNIYYTE